MVYQNNGKKQKRGSEKMGRTGKLRRVANYHLVSAEDKAEYLATPAEAGIIKLQKIVEQITGLETFTTYVDAFDDGTTALQKPEFMRMIKDAEEGKFDIIMTKDIFTFSTDVVEAVNCCRLLKAINVEVFFAEMGFNTFESIAEPLLERMKNFALTHDYMKRTAEEIMKERGFKK